MTREEMIRFGNDLQDTVRCIAELRQEAQNMKDTRAKKAQVYRDDLVADIKEYFAHAWAFSLDVCATTENRFVIGNFSIDDDSDTPFSPTMQRIYRRKVDLPPSGATYTLLLAFTHDADDNMADVYLRLVSDFNGIVMEELRLCSFECDVMRISGTFKETQYGMSDGLADLFLLVGNCDVRKCVTDEFHDFLDREEELAKDEWNRALED